MNHKRQYLGITTAITPTKQLLLISSVLEALPEASIVMPLDMTEKVTSKKLPVPASEEQLSKEKERPLEKRKAKIKKFRKVRASL